MEYATRWDIPFKDIQGTLRHIYIQQDGWSGNVTTLQGGNTPIDWDENNSDDLLKRIRIKTGHIEVIEEYQGQLVELMPTTSMSHKIVVPDMFVGYIKPQSSDMPFFKYPRTLKLNIVSLLSLADGIFPYESPGYWTGKFGQIQSYIEKIMGALQYKYLIMPTGNTEDTSKILDGRINVFALGSFALDKEYRIQDQLDYWNPQSAKEVLEKFCTVHDLIVHDTIIGSDPVLLFTRFSNPGDYYRYEYVSPYLRMPYGVLLTSEVLTNLFGIGVVSSAQNKEKIIFPYSGIDVYNEGEAYDDINWTLGLCYYDGSLPVMGFIQLYPRGPWIELSYEQAYVGALGKSEEAQKGVIVRGLPSPHTELFIVHFFEVDLNSRYNLHITFADYFDLGTLHECKVIINGLEKSWFFNNEKTYELVINGLAADVTGQIIVTFEADGSYIFVTDMKLEKDKSYADSTEDIFAEYGFVTKIDGTIGDERLEYKLALNDSYQSNLYLPTLSFDGSPYPIYLLQSQHKVVIYLRTNRILNATDYLQKYYIDNTGRRWRIIAISQNPRRCEAKITLISSYILD